MKAIVIGMGSMGRRRIRLLKECPDMEICGIDSNADRAAQVSRDLGVACYGSIAEAVEAEKPDCAFVCTSPLSHAAIIDQCLDAGLHVFTEINLVDDRYEENMRKAREKNLVLFLSSTAIYKEEMQAVTERVRGREHRLNYAYHVGQYLPDWHPWESYKDYFIGDKRTNGCREIMAIELPWLVNAFGKMVRVEVMKSKNTGLSIDYADSYLLMIEHETGAKGTFAVDVVSRKPVRRFECYGEDVYLSWNGTSDSLVEYDIEKGCDVAVRPVEEAQHVEGYAKFISENPYRKEIDAFMAQIADREAVPQWTFEKDRHVLSVINKIEDDGIL